jgi:hypothetical protein
LDRDPSVDEVVAAYRDGLDLMKSDQRRLHDVVPEPCYPDAHAEVYADFATVMGLMLLFGPLRQADVRRIGWSGVWPKRLAKPGRPQRSQRRSFVVGQPQASDLGVYAEVGGGVDLPGLPPELPLLLPSLTIRCSDRSTSERPSPRRG